MPGVLRINGVDYGVDERGRNNLVVDAYCAWELERGGDAWLEFHEFAGGPQPRFQGWVPVEYRDAGGVLRFKGVATLAQPGFDEGRTWGYRCVGLKYLMNTIPFTSSDFSGSIQFNLPITDEGSLPSRRGMSVGDIVGAIIDMNADAMASIGVSADATTETQLDAMTFVPVNAVPVSGQLANAIERVLFEYLPNLRMVILPTGLIRFIDASAQGLAGAPATAHTLTLGEDPVSPPLLRRDWAGCAPRVVARGQGDVRPFNGRETSNELQPAWTDPQRLSWNDAAFTHPGDASDVGIVTTTGGPTSVTIRSGDGARTWPANFWNKRQAWLHLKKSTGLGLNYSVSVPVTACEAMTAGGTCELTLGVELENSASDAWDSYELIGTAAPLEDDDGDTGLNNVWRLFNVVTPGGFVEQHLVTSSETPFPLYGLNNASVQLLNTPAALLVGDDGGAIPATFKIIPEKGQILFDEPIVRGFTSAEDLAIGGAAVTPPADILVLLLYSRGALEAAYPPRRRRRPPVRGDVSHRRRDDQHVRRGSAVVDLCREQGPDAGPRPDDPRLHQGHPDRGRGDLSGPVRRRPGSGRRPHAELRGKLLPDRRRGDRTIHPLGRRADQRPGRRPADHDGDDPVEPHRLADQPRGVHAQHDPPGRRPDDVLAARRVLRRRGPEHQHGRVRRLVRLAGRPHGVHGRRPGRLGDQLENRQGHAVVPAREVRPGEVSAGHDPVRRPWLRGSRGEEGHRARGRPGPQQVVGSQSAELAQGPTQAYGRRG